jgi:CheY-like chemotaxis protein
MTVTVAEPEKQVALISSKLQSSSSITVPLRVLLVGNNPMELNTYYYALKNYRMRKYDVDCCFRLKDGIKKLFHESFDCILVDDNFPLKDINGFIKKLKNEKIFTPVILLKSSLYNDIEKIDSHFLHKENLTSESLSRNIVQKIKETKIALNNPLIAEKIEFNRSIVDIISDFFRRFFARVFNSPLGYRKA